MEQPSIREICQQITQPIFFITPEINWALGLEKYLPNYHIICIENHPIIDLISHHCCVFCLQREYLEIKIEKNTGHLLSLPEVQNYIAQQSRGEQSAIIYFKPQPQIDKICRERGYLQIGNPADVARKFEDKLSLVKLGAKYPELQVLPSQIMKLQNIDFGFPLVIQMSRGWAGRSSYLIKSPNELLALQKKLGNPTVKVSRFIEGLTYLNNACVVGQTIYHSPPALQINCPHPEFSSLPLATCGRQWPASELNQSQIKQIAYITQAVGTLMAKENFQGYFGLDFMVANATGQVYLQEINARMTASASFYTQLEIEQGNAPLLPHHLLAFLDKNTELSEESSVLKTVTDVNGSQLILRNHLSRPITVTRPLPPGVYQLTNQGFVFQRVSYQVTDCQSPDEYLLISPNQGSIISPESELLRCESRYPLLATNSTLPTPLLNALLLTKQQLLKSG